MRLALLASLLPTVLQPSAKPAKVEPVYLPLAWEAATLYIDFVSATPDLVVNAIERLRLLHGNLPTAQTEDVAAREIVRPEYPEEARDKGIEGTVVLVALVNEEGKVEDVAVEVGVDPLLDQAAMRAAYHTPFFPYKIEGLAQAVFVRMPYRFELVGKLAN